MVDKKKNIDKNHLCYELIEDNEKNQYILLRYALLFRRFDKVDEIIEKLENKNIDIEVEFKKKIQNYNVSMFDILSWNQGYFNSYIKKNGLKSKYLNKINTLNEDLFTYDDFIDLKNKETVFTLFFKFKNLPESVQNILRKKNDNIKNIDDKVIPPILDVEYYEKQLIASKQVKKNGCSLVMDEVGTGKTVTALYAIRDVIEEANLKGEKAKILIVAPSNKKEDWKSDISRQLGRYAHIVKQKDKGSIYKEDLKKIYFKGNEQYIFICGQKKGKEENGSSSELKGTLNEWCKECKWDLIIIDEGHQNFNNYETLKSNKVMILTATPIIISNHNKDIEIKKDFESYREIMKKIIDYDIYRGEIKDINPIINRNPDENDIFVNWFREDFEMKPVTRNIKFKYCKRDENRLKYLETIKYIDNNGSAETLHIDQDDDYMFYKLGKYLDKIEDEELKKDIENKIERRTSNEKRKKLLEILSQEENKNKSYIIFCNHKFVINKIYSNLITDERFDKSIIACKSSDREVAERLEYDFNSEEGEELISSLLQNIRSIKSGKNKDFERVILIITSEMGGVGLNMGEFDGVINYELPFTNTSLEQRFGRVDRINNENKNGNEKEMIFMLNEDIKNSEGESIKEFDNNRMFYYCLTKINEVYTHMPVRNTLLNSEEIKYKLYQVIREKVKQLVGDEQEELVCDLDKIIGIEKEKTEKLKNLKKNYTKEEFEKLKENYKNKIFPVNDEDCKIQKTFNKELLELFKIKQEISRLKKNYNDNKREIERMLKILEYDKDKEEDKEENENKMIEFLKETNYDEDDSNEEIPKETNYDEDISDEKFLKEENEYYDIEKKIKSEKRKMKGYENWLKKKEENIKNIKEIMNNEEGIKITSKGIFYFDKINRNEANDNIYFMNESVGNFRKEKDNE